MRPLNSLIAALATAVGLVLPVKAGAQEWHYTNPVLHMDFSDPDVCQADGAYYMTASSFNFFPGLPILKSTDLVHWKQVGAALTDYPQPLGHGEGIWAPSIRYTRSRRRMGAAGMGGQAERFHRSLSAMGR